MRGHGRSEADLKALAALADLPATWMDLSVQGILESLAEALCDMLDLDCIGVSLAGGPEERTMKIARVGQGRDDLETLRPALTELLDMDGDDVPDFIDVPSTGQRLKVHARRFEIAREEGVLVTGTFRETFPTETDEVLITLALNQAFLTVAERRSREQVQRFELRYTNLVAQAPLSMQVFDPHGRTLMVNDAWKQLWGVTLEDLEDYNILEDRQLENKGALDAIKRGFAGEPTRLPTVEYDRDETLPLHASDVDARHWITAVIYPVKDAQGEVQEVILVQEDSTAKALAEEAERKALERLEMALRASDLGHWELGLSDHTATRNLRHDQIFGYDTLLPTWTYDIFLEHVVPDDREAVDSAFRHAIETQTPWDFECRIQRIDGEIRWIWARGQVFGNLGHRNRRMAGTVADISERKRLEEELHLRVEQLNEAARSKDEFIATLAHELRNPLSPIRTSLEIMKIPGVDEGILRQSRDLMERQVQHLVRLVDDLLDVARVMQGKIELRKEPIDLAAVVARSIETAHPFIESREHVLVVEIPDEPLPLEVDPVRMIQVIGNLLTNAAKYTEPGGRITVAAHREGDDVILRVVDTGIGIATEMLPHIFDVFVQVDHATTRAHGGLGLGLTLVKNFVELHGGRVEAHSAGPGTGSAFVVRLPLAREPVREAASADMRRPFATGSGRRLLVIDDNQDAARTLGMLLELQGFDVRIAHDGPSGLKLATEFRPKLILLDLGMPGMDGYAVVRTIRDTASISDTIVVALTGWGKDEDRRRTARAGFDHHLVKPVDPKELRGVLETFIDQGR
jgi:PAS domain S-box-containing protein